MSGLYPLAGRGRRLLATLIDMLLVPLLSVILIMMTDVLEDAEDYQDNLWMLWVLLLAIASYLLLNGYGLWKHGQTLGKRVMGIAIVDNNQQDPHQPPEPATFWKLICIRALFFPLLFLGLLAVTLSPFALLPLIDQAFIFGKNRRCLHDYASGTLVVRKTTSQHHDLESP